MKAVVFLFLLDLTVIVVQYKMDKKHNRLMNGKFPENSLTDILVCPTCLKQIVVCTCVISGVSVAHAAR